MRNELARMAADVAQLGLKLPEAEVYGFARPGAAAPLFDWCAEANLTPGAPLSRYRVYFCTWQEAFGWVLSVFARQRELHAAGESVVVAPPPKNIISARYRYR